YRYDWFRIIEDISREGLTLSDIAKELDVSKTAVIGWKQGAEPRYFAGDALISLWCHIKQRRKEDLPTQILSRKFIHNYTSRRYANAQKHADTA
ncbi:TPA: hypothetical protein ACNZ87_005515, partial [Klebsiella pneumoniae]